MEDRLLQQWRRCRRRTLSESTRRGPQFDASIDAEVGKEPGRLRDAVIIFGNDHMGNVLPSVHSNVFHCFW